MVVWNSVTQRELLRLQHSVTLCLCWGTFTSIFNFLGWKSMWNCCCLLFSHDEYVASVKCWRIHFSSTTIDHLSKSENAFSIFFSPSSSAYLSAAAACCLLPAICICIFKHDFSTFRINNVFGWLLSMESFSKFFLYHNKRIQNPIGGIFSKKEISSNLCEKPS